MRRYPIHDDFKRYARLVPPITRQTLPLLRAAQRLLPLPSPKKAGVILHRVMIRQGVHSIEAQLIEPMKKNDPLPALVYFHGGGFVLEAAPYHYALAMTYAAHTPCKVLFVRYHLAPQHPFPLPAEECFAAYLWTLRHVKTLGIREGTIAVGGDSAGGNLAAATALMARDRSILPPCAQLLVYPVIDHRMQSASMRRFTDTPMWNSLLSQKMWQFYLPSLPAEHPEYASLLLAPSLHDLPPAYVESAQFDCLHDEGIAYAQALRAAGVAVTLHETKGTMHGYDIVPNSSITQDSIQKRIAFLKEHFAKGRTCASPAVL